MNKKPNFEHIISLGKYIYWSDLCRSNFEKIGKKIKNESNFKFLFALSQWYASFYVVVEGCKELKLENDNINFLIDNFIDETDTLRKFRNTIYHYQKEIFDTRFIAGLQNQELILWISCLNCELKNFLWNYPKLITNDIKKVCKLQKDIFNTLNWKPKDILPAKIDKIKELVKLSIDEMAMHKDYESPEARNLLTVMNDAICEVKDLPMNPFFDIVKNKKIKSAGKE